MGSRRKKDKNGLNILGNKNKIKKKSKLLKRLIAFFTFLSTLPFIFHVFIIIVGMSLILIAGAGILQFFQEEENIVEEYDIDWGSYTCSCTFLTAEQIAQVRNGQEVKIDIDNSGGLNISGGDVVGSIDGLIIPSQGQLTNKGQYGIPIWSGYSMNDSGKDVIVPISTDNRIEPSIVYGESDIRPDTMSVSERAKHKDNYPIVSTEKFISGDCKTSNGRLELAVASGFIAWPDDPDRSNSMLNLNFDVVLGNGEVIPCVVKDAKANVHSGSLHMYYCGGIYRSNIPAEKAHIDRGEKYSAPDYSFLEFMASPREASSFLKNYIKDAGGIDHVKVYNHGRLDEGKNVNPNAVDATELVSSNVTNDTTTSFGTTGTGSVQTNIDSNSSNTINGTHDVSKFNISNAKGYVVVEGTGGSNCHVYAYKKNGNSWEKFVDTTGILGRNGMSNNRVAGDGTTPIGIWQLNTPFGQKDALSGFPGNYIKVDLNDWWSGSESTYNKMQLDIDSPTDEFKNSSENIGNPQKYKEVYNYVLDSGYNIKGIKGKGSALFLHCSANATSTSGCVGIPESEMIKILQEYEDSSWYIAQAPQGTFDKIYGSYGVNDGLSPNGDFSSSSSLSNSNNSSGEIEVVSTTNTYTNGQEIGLDSSWTYANESVINSGKAIYYAATDNRKDICIAVNAGHGTSNVGSKKTYCHPDHTAKVTGGTTGAGAEKAVAVSSGMTFNDGVSEAVANLKVAQAMKDDLLLKGYDVLMIRDGSDVQLDNVARTVISNNIADAHVAIHFDSTDSDSGAFYMSVPSNATYRAMEPVASHWQEHNALGDSLITGLKNNSIKVKSSSALEMDLTQTSYSEVPSVDIELGDHKTPHGDEECKKFGKALSDGINEFFKTHTPINQSKRVTSNLGGNTQSNTNANTTNNTSSNRVINKNKANLRTSCQMKTEGICGCYVSDPNCMCHIFGGDDGVLGTEDDNISQSKGDTGSGNIEGLTAEQSAAINAAREAMMAIAMAMKEQQPDLYKEGLTTTVGNPWYTNQLSGKCPKLTVTINGNQIPFGIRPDCSGLMTVTMIRLGVNLNSCYSTTDFGDNQNVIASTGLFEVLPYDRTILQPGDIICRYPSGHIEMFYKDLGDRLLHYSWGSTASAQHSFNVETEQLYDYDDIKPGGWQNYRIIFRYKGGK